MKEIAKALVNVQAKLKPAVKDSENPFFKSKYADLNSVWNACREALSSNGLAVSQVVIETAHGPALKTVLLHTSGETIEGVLPLINIKDMQSMGSAISYARRYSLAAIVGVVTEDDDAEAVVGPNRSQAMPLPQKPSYPLTPKENQPQRVGGISEAQGKRMFAIAKSHQWNTETMQNYIAWKYGVTHSRDLSREQYDDLCNNVLPNKEIAIQEMNEGGQAPLLFDGDASL